MFSNKFCDCLQLVLKLEGALNDNGGLNRRISDRGGLTKFGISQRAYPHLDIANLTLEKATLIYHRDYWRAMHCNLMPPGLALMLFDGAVNHGVPAMTLMLQRALNVKADGIIGKNTLFALKHSASHIITSRLCIMRARKYARICTKDPSQQPNLEGWFNRLAKVTELSIAHVGGVYA